MHWFGDFWEWLSIWGRGGGGGGGGGLMVTFLTFHSDNQSSNPAEDYSFL